MNAATSDRETEGASPQADDSSAGGATLGALTRAMPKVELHVHLEGSMRPPVLLRLAERHGIDLPARDEEGLRRWFVFQDFDHFVQIYLTCSACLRDPEDFHLLALDFLAAQGRQNIAYSEVHFTISTHLANGGDGAAILDALDAANREGLERFGARAAWIPDIVRNVPVERADQTLEWALAGRDRGVVALGLSGFESHANEPFAEHFETARREGLRLVAHAGEHAGPESIWSALDVCGAERIGHGIRALEDPALVERLVRDAVPLEVNPTSNVCLKAATSLPAHPFDRLRRAGVEVSVNSDDPPLFGTTLSDEYRLLGETFGYSAEDLFDLSRAALRHSFLPDDQKAALDRSFAEQWRALVSSDPVPIKE